MFQKILVAIDDSESSRSIFVGVAAPRGNRSLAYAPCDVLTIQGSIRTWPEPELSATLASST